MYDLQEQHKDIAQEANWRGLVLDWALPVANELADSDASAEYLTHVVCARWKQFIDNRQASQIMVQRESVNTALQARRQIDEREDLMNSWLLWRVVEMVGWVSFFGVCWLILQGFLR